MATATTLADLCKAVKIDVEYGAHLAWDEQDDWQRQANGYRVTLKYKRRQMGLDYWMGSGISHEPDAEGVLENLLSDASSADQTFEQWCADLGFDADSRRAERIYRAVQKQTDALRRLLGDDFDTFMNAERV